MRAKWNKVKRDGPYHANRIWNYGITVKPVKILTTLALIGTLTGMALKYQIPKAYDEVLNTPRDLASIVEPLPTKFDDLLQKFYEAEDNAEYSNFKEYEIRFNELNPEEDPNVVSYNEVLLPDLDRDGIVGRAEYTDN